jgi:predicted transcriptional regulator
VTDDGTLLAPSKVRPIQDARDALSAAENGVYELLWSVEADPGGEEPRSKTAQAGYDFIMKRTGLSKKTVQRVIDKLTEKGFIEIDTPADIYRRTSTIYRVYSADAVRRRQIAQQRENVAHIGPGVVYVRPLAPG